MADDDSNDSTTPPHLIIAPLTDRPLEDLPPAIAEALHDYPHLQEHTIAIRKDFLRLQERAHQALGPLLDGIEIGCPDLTATLAKWNGSLARGEVPADLGKISLAQAKERYLEGLFYYRVLGLIRSDVESALSAGLPTAGLMPTRREEEHLKELRAEGREAETTEYETGLVSQSIQAASDLSDAFASFLVAFRSVLNILVGVKAADLVRGRSVQKQRRVAGSSPKYARGIQAAVDHVYRPRMKEQECQDALLALIGQGFESEDGRYELYLDSAEGKVIVVQKDLDTGLDRSLQLGSVRPYFVRARNAQSS